MQGNLNRFRIKTQNEQTVDQYVCGAVSVKSILTGRQSKEADKRSPSGKRKKRIYKQKRMTN